MQPAVIPSIFDANVALLPARTQHLLLTGGAGDVHEVVIQASGPTPNVTALAANGRRVAMHEADDPVTASRQIVAQLQAQGPPAVLIVIGIGLGYVLDALEHATLPTKVIALEPLPGVARAMLARRDWTRWLASGRLTLLVGPDYAGATDAWRVFDRPDETPGVIMAPVIGREFPEAAARAKDVVRQVLGGVKANDDARRKFAGRYLLNTLANLPSIATEGDAGALSGAFPNVPALVIGAGPSLDRNLPLIRAAAGHALIIAVDTGLRPLLAAGLPPTLVVAVDPSDANARHLRDLDDTRGVWLVAEPSIATDVFDSFAQRTFTFRVANHEPWPWLNEQGLDRGRLRAWGSVLTTAFDLACVAGCNPIVFAGADLAYSRGLQYCRNTSYEQEWKTFTTDEARAEEMRRLFAAQPHPIARDVHGDDVRTTSHYMQFRDWIVSRVAELDTRTVINVTGAGILHGSRILQASPDEIPPSWLSGERHGDLHQRLAALWSRGIEHRGGDARRLGHAVDPGGTLPLDRWTAFADQSVPTDQITDAAQAASRELVARGHLAEYCVASRQRVDNAAGTLAEARALVHPDYEWARRQARAHHGHLLCEVAQRLYPPAADASTLDVVHAASRLPHALRVLDFGCGVGRSMEPMIEAGFRADGVDFSEHMLSWAKETETLEGSELYLSHGTDCGAAPDGAYDVACAVNTLHHVVPRRARLQILRAMARALRPGGVVFVQLPFLPGRSVAEHPERFLPWSTDLGQPPDVDVLSAQVWPTPDELPLVYEDFTTEFVDVRLQFVDFPPRARRFGLAPELPLCHLIVSGTTTSGLAERMYTPIEEDQPPLGAGER